MPASAPVYISLTRLAGFAALSVGHVLLIARCGNAPSFRGLAVGNNLHSPTEWAAAPGEHTTDTAQRLTALENEVSTRSVTADLSSSSLPTPARERAGHRK